MLCVGAIPGNTKFELLHPPGVVVEHWPTEVLQHGVHMVLRHPVLRWPMGGGGRETNTQCLRLLYTHRFIGVRWCSVCVYKWFKARTIPVCPPAMNCCFGGELGNCDVGFLHLFWASLTTLWGSPRPSFELAPRIGCVATQSRHVGIRDGGATPETSDSVCCLCQHDHAFAGSLICWGHRRPVRDVLRLGPTAVEARASVSVSAGLGRRTLSPPSEGASTPRGVEMLSGCTPTPSRGGPAAGARGCRFLPWGRAAAPRRRGRPCRFARGRWCAAPARVRQKHTWFLATSGGPALGKLC